jgi:hypothetical protein
VRDEGQSLLAPPHSCQLSDYSQVDTMCLHEGDARKVDIRLPGKGNSNSRGARPVY